TVNLILVFALTKVGDRVAPGEALKVDGAVTVVVDITNAIEVIIKTAITNATFSFTYPTPFFIAS
ncbi:MAG: hypothetical protein ACE5OT_04075, partial [Candidatus Hadarchaeaceae archaeon]